MFPISTDKSFVSLATRSEASFCLRGVRMVYPLADRVMFSPTDGTSL